MEVDKGAIRKKGEKVGELESKTKFLQKLDLYFHKILVEESGLINNSPENILGIYERLPTHEKYIEQIQKEFEGAYKIVHRALAKRIQRCNEVHC